MQKREFEGVLGSVPKDFTDSVAHTLKQLDNRRPEMHKPKMKLALIAALMLVLLAGTAVAINHRASVLDMRSGALPAAKDAVENLENSAFESKLVKYQPIDAIIDGGQILLTLEASPKDPERYMMMTAWSSLNDIDDETGLTLKALAEQSGKTWISTDVSIASVNGLPTLGGNTADPIVDGKVIYSMAFELPDLADEKMEIEIAAFDQEVLDQIGEDAWDGSTTSERIVGEMNETRFSFEISTSDLPAQTLVFEGPFEMEYMTVNRVEMNRSAVSLGMKVEYTYQENLTDAERKKLALVMIRLADPTGQQDLKTFEYDSLSWRSSVVGSKGWETDGLDGAPIDGHSMIEVSTYPAIESWPDQFELIPYYKETTEWGTGIVLQCAEAANTGN